MPNKTWVVGEEVLAPDFNTYVQQQVIAGFPTVATRTAGLPAPVRGQASYVAAGDVTEGPEYFDGVAWRKPWNQPWGYLSAANAGANSPALGNNVDIPFLLVTFTAVANRRYKITASLYGGNQVGAGASEMYIVDGSGGKLAGCVVARAAGDTPYGFHVTTITTAPAGAVTYKLRNFTSATGFTYYGGATSTGLLLVEDIGPLGGSPT